MTAISDPQAGLSEAEGVSLAELALAARNHGMPLEALRHAVTPLGLHYLLTHYDIPFIDPASWRLELGGQVDRPLSLDLDALRRRERRTLTVTFECAGNGRAALRPRPVSQPWLVEAIGTARWTGTPLAPLLREAGLRPEAREVVFRGADRGVEGGIAQAYERSLPLAEALAADVLLAYEVDGRPLPPQHGSPLRLVVPGWYGMANVKWLTAITVVAEPFRGYQQEAAYRLYDEAGTPGEPVTRMQPRALMVPPGVPDFMTRERHLPAGAHTLEGRAWSGWAPVASVEVSVDGGLTWRAAELGEADGPHAWRPWRLEGWKARPGTYELRCRARDAAGRSQPDDPPWNRKGYANNSVQRLTVHVGSELLQPGAPSPV